MEESVGLFSFPQVMDLSLAWYVVLKERNKKKMLYYLDPKTSVPLNCAHKVTDQRLH